MARWSCIVGPRGGSRVAAVERVVESLTSRSVRVAGFVQRNSVDEENGRAILLRRLGHGDETLLMREERTPRPPSDESFCHMAIDPAGFARGRGWLLEDAAGADVLVIDELAHLEADGTGHFQAAAWALAQDAPFIVMLSVRSDHLFAIVERLGLSDDAAATLELPGVDGDEERFVEMLLSRVRDGA